MKEQQRQSQEHSNQYEKMNERYSQQGHFNPYEYTNQSSLDPNDPLIKQAHRQWMHQMEIQRQADQAYNNQMKE